MSEAIVTPSVLQWARERCELSQDELAEKARVRPTQIKLWESGNQRPTLRQASILASKLRVPLGYLFLERPPKLEDPLPDLRTVGAWRRREVSIDLRETLNDALLKRDWYREYLLNEGAEPLAYVGRFSERSSLDEIAADIRKELDLGDFSGQERPGGPEGYRKLLTERAEAVGVSVLRSSYVRSNTRRALSVREFRGFAIVDDIAPLIFINGQDAVTAQIFTLIHELAHLWIGVQGISDSSLEPAQKVRAVEGLCNGVAAEVLVPAEEFAGCWLPAEALESQVVRLSKRFNVSELVILRRAEEQGFITKSEFLAHYETIRNRTRGDSGGGGSFYASLRYRNGVKLSGAILAQAAGGAMPLREAAALLNMKVPTVLEAAERAGLL